MRSDPDLVSLQSASDNLKLSIGRLAPICFGNLTRTQTEPRRILGGAGDVEGIHSPLSFRCYRP